MEQLQQSFLDFISVYGYFAIALLMALENACIPIPSELILGFAGYLVYADQITFAGAMIAGIVGGMAGSIFAYLVGSYGGRKFVNKYGKYFLIKKSHVDLAQRWFDKYGLRAVFFSRMLPVVRTFISLPAGFARVNFPAFLTLTFLGSVPWTALIIYLGVLFGENWKKLLEYGHEASIVVVIALVIAVIVYAVKSKKNRS